jgi:hypothetical protein
VEDPLADYIINSRIEAGDTIMIGLNEARDAVALEVKHPEETATANEED